MPAFCVHRTILLLPVLAAAVLCGIAFGPSTPAEAEVVRLHGIGGRVDTDPGWFGSYSLGEGPPAWCIDSQLPAPDSDLDYRPVDPGLSPEVTTAVAWLLGRHEPDGPVAAAAIGLAVHDLVDAPYPSGPLDAVRLTPGDLVGFGGQAATVLDRARQHVDDARAHRHLRAPFRLAVHADPAVIGASTTAVARLVDAEGRPVVGIDIALAGTGAEPTISPPVTTDAEGRARFRFRAVGEEILLTATTTVPDLTLEALGPTVRPAQRVVRAGRAEHTARVAVEATPPTGRASIRKIDAATGETLPGARLTLEHDPEGDGTYEPLPEPIETGIEASIRDGLAPGRYRLVEVEPPDGYELASSPIDLTVEAGQTVEVVVPNRTTPVVVRATKVDATTEAPLAGATYDLYRASPADPEEEDEAAAAAPGTPADAAGVPGHRWVGRATSDGDGAIVWADQQPGAGFCALEVSPPPGYQQSPEPVCTEGPVEPGAEAHLMLTDIAVDVPESPPPTTTTPPTTAPASNPARPAPAPATGTLARTGGSIGGWSAIGGGLVLAGVGALLAGRPPRTRP